MKGLGETTTVVRKKVRSLLSTHGQYEDLDTHFEKAPKRSAGNLEGLEQQSFDPFGSVESLPTPERPPLRQIDKYLKPECPCISKRYTVAILTCLGFIISFGMRCNMSMAKLKRDHNVKMNCSTDLKFHVADNCTHGIQVHHLFQWTPAQETLVDSSFYYGYLLTQVPGGFLASMYPANRIFGFAIVSSSVLNLLIPVTSMIDESLLVTVRIMQGLVEGVTYPASHGIWRHWAPPLERSRLATLAMCGSYAGIVIGMPTSGILMQFVSWQCPFYFYGIMGIVWFTAWNWLVFEKPSLHPSISARELNYIEKSLGQTVQLPAPTLKTCPWKDIFNSMPVWAIIAANFCRSWNFYLLVLYQAAYFHDSFGFGMAESGLVGSLPHLLMTIIVPNGGLLADHLRKKGILTTTIVRKLFNCGGFGMEAFFFLCVANSDSADMATLCLTIGVACSGFAISGFNVNHLDIAPRYASILMGISNGVGTSAGFILPYIVTHITASHTKRSWRLVFVLAAMVHFMGVTFYGTFASGEVQPWAETMTVEQNQMTDVRPITKKKSAGYGTIESTSPPEYQTTTLTVQPESQDVYMNEERSLDEEVPGDKNPFKRKTSNPFHSQE